LSGGASTDGRGPTASRTLALLSLKQFSATHHIRVGSARAVPPLTRCNINCTAYASNNASHNMVRVRHRHTARDAGDHLTRRAALPPLRAFVALSTNAGTVAVPPAPPTHASRHRARLQSGYHRASTRGRQPSHHFKNDGIISAPTGDSGAQEARALLATQALSYTVRRTRGAQLFRRLLLRVAALDPTTSTGYCGNVLYYRPHWLQHLKLAALRAAVLPPRSTRRQAGAIQLQNTALRARTPASPVAAGDTAQTAPRAYGARV